MVGEMVKILKCMVVNALPSPLQLLSSKNYQYHNKPSIIRLGLRLSV